MLGAGTVTMRDGAFSLKVDPARAAEINRALVTGGVDVSELQAGQRSLEDVFIELTGTEGGL
jgi:ABC-2 type transport system ATP-binding protein